MPRRPRSEPAATRRPALGASLPEVLIALAIVGLVGGAAWRALSEWADARASREAARGFLTDLRQVAHDARRQRRSLAIEFDLGSRDLFRVIADGNGNGVTAVDIANGIDTAEGDWRLVFREGRARLGVLRDLPNADGTGTVAGGSSPVQMGAMSRVLFTPRGTATAASIYVAGRGERAYAIRLLGSTQRLRLLCLGRYDTWESC